MARSHQPARANRSTCCKDSFWVVEVPDKSVDVHPGAGKARFALEGFKIEDYHDLVNALADGPSVDADLSFDCRRSDGIQTRFIRNPDPLERFTESLCKPKARIAWSASVPTEHFAGLLHRLARVVTIAENARRDLQSFPTGWEAGIRGHLYHGFEDFFFCGAISECHPNIQFDGAGSSKRGQCCDCAEAAGL